MVTGLEIECSGHCDASNVGTPGDSGFEIYDDGVHVMHGENIFDADGHAIGATYDLRPALNYIPPLTSDIATNPATAARYAHERRVIERYVPRVERASAASRALGAVRDVGADVIGAGGEVGVLPEILAGLRALPSALRSAGSVVERGLAALRGLTTGSDDVVAPATRVGAEVLESVTAAPRPPVPSPRVVEDSFGGWRATWDGHPASRVWFSTGRSGLVEVSDIYRGTLAPGSAGEMLTSALREAGLSTPSAIRFGHIVNQPTVDALASGADPAATVLGRTLLDAATRMGASSSTLSAGTDGIGHVWMQITLGF